MSNIKHDIVCSSMLDECLQLILHVFGLLPGQPRDRIVAMQSPGGRAVAVFAVSEFGLKLAARYFICILGGRDTAKFKCKDGRTPEDSRVHELDEFVSCPL